MSGGDLLFLGLFVATWGGMLWIYRHLTDAMKEQSEYRSEQHERERSALPAVPTEVTQVALQLQQAAHELSEALDVRTEKLKQLMAQCDARILALSAVADPPASDIADGGVQSAAPDHGLAAGGDQGPTVAASAGHVGDTHENAVPPAADAPDGAQARQRGSVEDIRRLAAEGLDPATIAARTHRGREEVRLLLQNLNAPRKGNKS